MAENHGGELLVTAEEHREVLARLDMLTSRTDQQDSVLADLTRDVKTMLSVLSPFIISRCQLCKLYDFINDHNLWKPIFAIIIIWAGDNTIAELLGKLLGMV